MSTDGERAPDRLAARIVGRLRANTRTLVAAVLALVVVDLAAGGTGLFAAVGIVAVLAVAALSPPAPVAANGANARGPREVGIDALPATDLAAAVQDPLFIFDREGEILYANETAMAAFGPVSPGLSLQLKFRAPEMHAFVRQVLEPGGAPAAIDYVERVPVERAYRVAATPIGEVSGLFVLLFRDQSETRRIDRMRADFIANASHELRTPLASVAGFIETLRGPARDDAKARENFLQIMQDQTGRMARLIDDLLSLSRLETKPYLKPGETVDIARMMVGVIDATRHLAAEYGVEIESAIPETPTEVAGNRDELVQVFENLLENACKYGSSGGRVVVTVERAPPDAEGAVRATVRDFGPGIAEEHIPRITERFYRVDVETSRAQKGTGLGLAIVKHILTRHDARLSVTSELGEGAAFTVQFPVSGEA